MRAALRVAVAVAAGVLATAGCRTSALPSSRATTREVLSTAAERSGYRITGRYDEVERLCRAYQRRWPDAVSCLEIGRSPEGRPMLALAATRTGARTPAAARARGVPVVLFQGGIHAGEIDGKDAGFLALREMLEGRAARGALEAAIVLFVPVLNVDGHERFGAWNRPNQNGPAEMGWRTTAQNLNLNRDFCKADAPELRVLLELLLAWDPILYVDLHATDGAQFEHDVSVIAEPRYAGDPGLHHQTAAILAQLVARLRRHGSLPVDFYPSLMQEDDPASGFKVDAYGPRFSTGYWALHNRFAILVETHSWKDYATRVRVTRNAVIALAEMTARQGAGWMRLARDADRRAERLGGQEVALDFDPDDHVTSIEFRGYAYTREPSPISGGLATRYDPTVPQIWRVPLRDRVHATRVARAPAAGYVVPAAEAPWMAERLALHGIAFRRLTAGRRDVDAQAFRATAVTFGAAPFEGRTSAAIEGAWAAARIDVPAGSLFVPIAQPRARLVVTLLDPQGPDSYAAWGFFNRAFERKEYMERYVAEEIAAAMLASRPEVAAEFQRRLASDPAFAADPAARLDFFYRLHPSWDARHNLYPVLRVDREP